MEFIVFNALGVFYFSCSPRFLTHLFFPPFGVSVGNVAAQRRRQNAISVGKERRESLVRAKRFCRAGVSSGDDGDISLDHDMVIDEEESILEAQTSSAVEELKAAVAFQ